MSIRNILIGIVGIFVLTLLNACSSSKSPKEETLVAVASTYAYSDENVTMNAIVNSDLNYTLSWTQIEGETVTLDDSTSASPTFTVPSINKSSTLSFEVAMTDENNVTLVDSLDIAIFPSHLLVDAGQAKGVPSGSNVSLHGNANLNDENTLLKIVWTQDANDSAMVSLTDGDTFNPIFIAPHVQSETILNFHLNVSNDFFSGEDNVTIRVLPTSGPQVGLPQTIVTHSGTAVVVHSQTVVPTAAMYTHAWTQVSGPTVTLTNTDQPQVPFVAPQVTSSCSSSSAPAQNQVVLQHKVTDTATGVSTTTFHTVVITPVASTCSTNPPLSLILSNKNTVGEGNFGFMHISATGGTGPYTFATVQKSGSTATLTNADTNNVIFTAPVVNANEVIEFEVTVTDANGDTKTQVVPIIVENLSLTVIGNADALTHASHTTHLYVGHNRTLDPYSYLWSEINGTSATISAPATGNPAITLPAGSGIYTFKIEVTDALGNKGTDTVDVKVVDDLHVDAGTLQIVKEDSNVTLHALSTGNLGAATLLWSQSKGPTVTLNKANTLNPNFIAPLIYKSDEVLEFQLNVTDSVGRTETDFVDIIVKPKSHTVSISAPNQLQEGSSSHATCNVSGGKPPFTYQWNHSPLSAFKSFSGATDQNISFELNTGLITPVIFSCTAIDSLSRSVIETKVISVYTPPPAPVLTIATHVSNSIKENELAVLSVQASGGTPPYTYNWYKNSGHNGTINQATQANASYVPENLIVPLYALDIFVDVTDATGQTVTGREVIAVHDNPLIVSVSGPTSILLGDTLNLHANVQGASGNYTYQWYKNTTLLSGTTNQLSHIANSVGTETFSVKVTDTVQGVAEIVDTNYNVTVKANPIIIAPIADRTYNEDYHASGGHPIGITGSKFSPQYANETYTYTITEVSGNSPAVTPTIGKWNVDNYSIEYLAPTISSDVTYTFKVDIANSTGTRKGSMQFNVTHTGVSAPALISFTTTPTTKTYSDQLNHGENLL